MPAEQKDDYKKKVLLIDDDELGMTVLERALKQEGFEVLTTNDGEEGLGLAFSECPDIILLDIILPGMSGIDVLREVRRDGCCKDTPVILLTNYDKSDVITEALDAGRCDFMIKTNWDIKDVVKRIKKHLRVKEV